MKKYLIIYSYVDEDNVAHFSQQLTVFAQNTNEAFIIGAGKLFAFFNNTTDTLQSFNLSEVTEE